MANPQAQTLTEDAQRLATQAAARPGDPVVRARLALALDALASPEAGEALAQAMGLARTCLELGIVEPANEAAELLYRQFRGQPGTTGREVALLMADATLQRNGGAGVDAARKLLEAVVAEHPDAVGARLRVAALALGLGEAEAARRWIEPVASASTQTRTLYVQTLVALGAADEAIAEAHAGLEAGIASTRDASLLYQLMGIAELSRGDADAAIEALSEGLRLAPDDAVAYYNLALAFEASGSRPAALGVCDAGLELAPADARLTALKARLAQ